MTGIHAIHLTAGILVVLVVMTLFALTFSDYLSRH